MHRTAKHGSPVARVRRVGVLLLLLALMAGLAAPAVASHTAEVTVLPGASSAEGRTVDRKSTRLNSSHTEQSRMPSSA